MCLQNNKPLVTVTLSAYNHEQFVEKAILSIVNQTYGFQNIELLVIDDCSQDNTGTILRELSKLYNFKFFQNEKNLGVVKNVNKLRKMAKGKYVAGCASDDFWHISKLEKQVKLMESLGDDYALCHTDAYIIDEKDHVIFYQRGGKNYTDNIMPKILINNEIVAPSVIMRRKAYDIVGYYDEDIPFEDREFWIRLGLKFKFAHIHELLVFRRKHPNNLSYKMVEYDKSMEKIFSKYMQYYKQYNLVDEYHYMMFTHMSYYHFKISLKHLMKIKKKSLILRKSTITAFMKLLVPKTNIFTRLKFYKAKVFKSW